MWLQTKWISFLLNFQFCYYTILVGKVVNFPKCYPMFVVCSREAVNFVLFFLNLIRIKKWLSFKSLGSLLWLCAWTLGFDLLQTDSYAVLRKNRASNANFISSHFQSLQKSKPTDTTIKCYHLSIFVGFYWIETVSIASHPNRL